MLKVNPLNRPSNLRCIAGSIVGCFVLGAAVMLSSGCSKSSGNSAPVVAPTRPTPVTKNPYKIPAGPGPELTSIELVDIDNTETVTFADEIVFTFNDDVTIRPTVRVTNLNV